MRILKIGETIKKGDYYRYIPSLEWEKVYSAQGCKVGIDTSHRCQYARKNILQRTIENMWLRLKAFAQTLRSKASHILKRCVKLV